MFSYVMSMLMSLMMLSMVFVMITMSAASGRRIAEVLTEKADLTNPEHPVEVVPDGSIDFNHVSFSYKHGSGEETLHDIDLHIPLRRNGGHHRRHRLRKIQPGQLDQPAVRRGTEGQRYGGRTGRAGNTIWKPCADQVAVVLQKNVLFSGTILDNLRWGKEDATLEECEEACRAGLRR